MKTQYSLIKPLFLGLFVSLALLGICETHPILKLLSTPIDKISAPMDIESGGTISGNEIICNSGTPTAIHNLIPPVIDGDGFLFIQWEEKTLDGIWTVIPGATTLEYAPPMITETTHYRRGARQVIYQPWRYSNIAIKSIVVGIEDIKISTKNLVCKGGSNGSAKATVIGGSPSFIYEWSTGETTREIINLPAGYISVTVTDQNGCNLTSETVEITEPERSVYITEYLSFKPSCSGSEDGGITIFAVAGEAPYNYYWSNGESSDSNWGLSAGNYSVIVEDQLGCKSELLQVEIEDPSAVKIMEKTIPISCYGVSDGEIIYQIAGGISPYRSFLEDSDGNSIDIFETKENLAAGKYLLFGFDNNFCPYEKEIIIESTPLLETTEIITNNKTCKATINLFPKGGTAPFSYTWSNDSNTESFSSNLCPGFYHIEVTDANGCKTDETLEIEASYTMEELVVKILDNPFSANGQLLIKLPTGYTEANVAVYTISGQLVEKHDNLIPQTEKEIQLELNMDKYENGIYLITATSGGLSTSERLIISRQ